MSMYVYVGCMAERLKTKILETDKMVDLVAGPGEREIHTHQVVRERYTHTREEGGRERQKCFVC